MRIAVVGAGIAGLTAAIAFGRRGAEVTVLEQAHEMTEVGAGLQLSPNASAILDRLGLLPAIEQRWNEVARVVLRSGRSLRQIAEVPAGDFARRRWRAPYGVIHRSDLQGALLEAATALPGCRLLTGQRIEAKSPEGVRRQVCDRVGHAPALIVGADGVWSSLRGAVPSGARASFSGHIAWRTMVERQSCAGLPVDCRATTAFLGPRAHVVVYPMRGCDVLNVVVVTSAPEGGSAPPTTAGIRQELSDALDGWSPPIGSMIAACRAPTPWPLYEVGDGSWTAGKDIVLIGDAAHAIPPFAAQGAAMAIEDAFDLAEGFVRAGPASLAPFAERRKQRVAQVARRGAFNRFAYHAQGPIRLGRDLVLAMRRPESLAAELDWLYGYLTPSS